MISIVKKIIFLGLIVATFQAKAVGFSGAFLSTGNYDVAGQRVAVGLEMAKPYKAYYLGGALFRLSNRPQQQRLKDSLLYDLKLINSLVSRSNTLSQRLCQLTNKITQMRVTGRERAELNPGVLQSQFAKNNLLQRGDKIHLPHRPSGIYIAGAVLKSGLFQSQSGDMRVHSWLTKLQVLNKELDWVWVVQPDGQVKKVPVATWNRTKYKEIIMAPGAILFIPFPKEAMRGVEPGFEERLAAFLATQLFVAVQGL